MSWQDNFASAHIGVGCVLKRGGQYLLVQEKQEKAHGLWSIPAGHVDKGESLEQAAIREAREEAGFEVSITEEIAIIHESVEVSVKHIYRVEIIGGTGDYDQDEIMQTKWLTFDEIVALNEQGKIRRPWIFEVLDQTENLA